VRSRVAALDNVEFRYEARVEDVTTEAGRVTGVKIAHTTEPISADLVIDAMGRGGKTLQWLDRLGFDRPPQNVVNCDFAYTSVFMKPRAPDIFTDVGFFVMSSPRARGGGLVPAGLASEGLPSGVQLAGRRFEEARVLGVAREIEQRLPWRDRQPPLG
jgi:2-polyprenyl-6-methoxyphenol hydroxylase-like FAD-dependent oxidoreductase